jgi:hypothetical protein
MKTDDTSNPTSGHTKTVSQKVVAAQRAILDKLAACELKFAEVYAAYSNTFPATSDFWLALNKEELDHAAMLEAMKRFLDAGHYFRNIGVLAKGVESMIAELDREVSMAKQGFLTEPQALNHAMECESRLIDGHFYDIVNCGAPEFQHMATVLRKGAELHRNRIRGRMNAGKG